MKNKLWLILFTLISLIAFLILGMGNFAKDTKLTNKLTEEAVVSPSAENTIEPLEFTEEQLESYYSSYQNPYVLHLRKALDGYLDGSNEGMEAPEAVINPGFETKGAINGLSKFDKEYYQSKFMVFTMNDSLAGGKEIAIIFQDKPDKLFTAWVYKLAGQEEAYDLRGFWQVLGYDEKKMEETRQLYKNQLEDKEHVL
jgi:hypothetical protein